MGSSYKSEHIAHVLINITVRGKEDAVPKARERALVWLGDRIARARTCAENRLPTLAVMASECGVSPVTMMHAVRELRHRGVLCVSHGAGIRIVGTGDESVSVRKSVAEQRRPTAAQALAKQLRARIDAGDFADRGMVPSRKELVSNFRVSYRTVNAALRLLADRGIVEPHGKSYRVARQTVAGVHPCIVFIARSIPGPTSTFVTERTEDQFRRIEHACAAANVDLVLCPVLRSRGRLFFEKENRALLRGKAPGGTVLGYVVRTQTLEDTTGRFMEQLLHTLHQTGKPVAALEDRRESAESIAATAPSSVKIITGCFDHDIGRHIARLAIDIGHTGIAYVTAYPRHDWSVEREEGVREVVRQRRNCTLRVEHAQREGPLLAEQFGAAMQELLRVLDHERDLLARETVPLSASVSVRGRVHASPLLNDASRRQELCRTLYPCFGTLARDSRMTVWICANDYVALTAQEFFRVAALPPERQPSLVGIDDTLEASIKGISSYSYDTAAATHMVMNHILSPRRIPRRARDERLAIVPGTVIRRSSLFAPR